MQKNLLITSALLLSFAVAPAMAQDKGSGSAAGPAMKQDDMKKDEMKGSGSAAPAKMDDTKATGSGSGAPMTEPMKKDEMKGSGSMQEKK